MVRSNYYPYSICCVCQFKAYLSIHYPDLVCDNDDFMMGEKADIDDFGGSESASDNGIPTEEQEEEERRAQIAWQRDLQLRRAVKVSNIIVLEHTRISIAMSIPTSSQLEPDDAMVDVKPIINRLADPPVGNILSAGGDDLDDDDDLFDGLNPMY